MKKKKSGFLFLLVITGVILFAVIAFVVLKSTSTKTAIVPAQNIPAGTTIESSMLQTIDIPSNTPDGYITDAQSLIGQKLKIDVNTNQLLYVNNVVSSWEDLSEENNIPKDYVITSITLPTDRAVSGLITSGDVIDLLGVPNSQYNTLDNETLTQYLGSITENSYGEDGINLYWVLSNVKILQTDTQAEASQNGEEDSENSSASNSSDGNSYVIALSYQDYERLRLCEQYLDFYMNISPSQNEDNGPMLDDMLSTFVDKLKDAQAQSKYDKEGNLKPIKDNTKKNNKNNSESEVTTENTDSENSTEEVSTEASSEEVSE